LTGEEIYDLEGLPGWLAAPFAAGRTLDVRARRAGSDMVFQAIVRIETPQEVNYFLNGGILPFVLRQLLRAN
jgi:aconitate hydratase